MPVLLKWDNILRQLWIKSRFTSYFYQSVFLIEDESLPTLGLTITNSGLSLHFNPDFIGNYTDYELTGLLVHEMMHIMLNHKHRIIPGNDTLLQNLAQDMVINSYITENRKNFFSRTGRDIRDEPPVVLPKGLPLIPEKFYSGQIAASLKYDPSWEDVYYFLKENQNEKFTDTTDGDENSFHLDTRFQMPDFSFNKKQKTETIPDFFNNDGVIFKDGENKPLAAGVHFFREPRLDDIARSIKKRVVNFSARDENCTAERFYQEISVLINKKKPAKIKNFDKIVKRFLNQSLCADDWSLSSGRFNRRYFGQGIYAPGRLLNNQPSLIVAIDVSGSMLMKPEEIEKAFGVIESLLKSFSVYLICIDEDVFVPRKKGDRFIASGNKSDRYKYRKGDWKYIKTASNAATFFAPLFDTFMTGKKEPLVVITDGEIYDMDRLKVYKQTLWAVPAGCEKTMKPAFGRVVVIE